MKSTDYFLILFAALLKINITVSSETEEKKIYVGQAYNVKCKIKINIKKFHV